MKRTRLSQRQLPSYSRGEELMNMITHIAGGGIALLGLVACVSKAVIRGQVLAVVCAAVYGVTLVGVYAMSSIYHGLHTGTAKKVMQVIDHCAIYFLIAGTYTPILLSAFLPAYPAVGWGLLAAEWVLATIAVTLTAIDLKRYTVFSMICYIFMGWGIVFFLPQTMAVLGKSGFFWLLLGGIAYTVGAVLYGVGSKKAWLHSVFHIFVVAGSFLQFIAIYLYVL